MRPMSSTSDGKGLIPRGFHVHVDCVGYIPPATDDHSWILQLMREAVRNSHAREVHAHVVPFDGSISPPGFAAVVLIDESHVTAHCYTERGLLALDVFTCGDHDPDSVADLIHGHLMAKIPGLRMAFRERVDRFRSE